MQTAKIKIAEREYEIKKLKIAKNREWRKEFEAPINKLLAATKAIGSLTGIKYDKPSDLFKEVGAVLFMHSDAIVRVLLDSMDTVVNAVFAYSPEMKFDRKWIEENGDDEEMVSVFIEVVKLAFPFTSVFQAMSKLGQMAEQTSLSSPDPSGASKKTT